jgi:hypothetical protein
MLWDLYACHHLIVISEHASRYEWAPDVGNSRARYEVTRVIVEPKSSGQHGDRGGSQRGW